MLQHLISTRVHACEAPGPEEIRSGSSLKEEGKSRRAPQHESTAKTTHALFMDKKTRSCCFNFGQTTVIKGG